MFYSKRYSRNYLSGLVAAVLAVPGVSVFPAAPAHAQTGCDSRAAVIEGLKQTFQENPVAIGVEQSGNLVELLTADDGDSWTLVVTRPDGISCIAAAGENWSEIQGKTEEGAPS